LINQEWVGPLNQIWEVMPSTAGKHKGNDLFRNLLSHFQNIQSIRRFISGVRNPTHLIWLVRKID
jgi:hypothetical protein